MSVRDTPQGTQVTPNGCPIPAFPADQFTVGSNATSCIGTNTGKINITSKIDGEFIAVITGNDRNESLNFNDSLMIENLPKGSYDICIGSSNEEYIQSCYSIIVQEPEPLSVTTSMDFVNKTVTLKVSGSTNYIIQLNEETIESSLNSITLPLDRINNELVVTSKECQGTYTETIILEDSLIAFPNPFDTFLNIDVSNIPEGSMEIKIFDITGKLVFNDKFTVEENIRPINTSSFKSGFYFAQLTIGEVKKVIKVFKS
ncbi:T9SS type A sorting domain-containing protein [Maribacter litopenaei]|uniref:T9SS type A sorting domain-containing protein n=1 Tax=Maribacter litopenaei TaxID=2976127 RepID=A0ABY5YAI8_9FLAO|nr:T9SS type A sorting domain-containing protein [Maribacter litopenaei]UWX56063.1 T9SS type A sorting domain-containing protein [Maribacter litopenaei]